MATDQHTPTPSAGKLSERRSLWLELQDLGLAEIVDRFEIAQDMLDEAVTEMGAYPGTYPETFDEWSTKQSRCEYLVSRIGDHVGELREAIAGARPARDLPAAWREFKETEAAAAAAHDEDGEIDVEGPEWRRFMAAKDALTAARPTDAAGLAAQVKFYVDLHAQGHDPNEDQRAMLAHVADQLEALASVPADGAGATGQMSETHQERLFPMSYSTKMVS